MSDVRDSKIYQTYLQQNDNSRAHAERARACIPTGTSRSLLKHQPFPFYVACAEGIRSTDLDGNTRIDFHNNYTTMIHAASSRSYSTIPAPKR